MNLLTLLLKVVIDSGKMYLWFWILEVSLYFIYVCSLPTLQARSLKESSNTYDWNPKSALSESVTARTLPQGKDQLDNVSIDHVQNILENLKISARADPGYKPIQLGKHLSCHHS
jgi:hypothetical protein